MTDAATLRAHFHASLSESDPDIAQAIRGELARQQEQIELIASENLVSRAVLEAHGSVMTNKTVEGYPGKRYYGGAEFADKIEALGIARARQLFGCAFANIQSHSGSQANQAVFLALLKPGDTILSMKTNAGGHISHGHPANQTGKLMDGATAAFAKANPDIKIETTGYTGDQAGFTKLTQAVQGGGAVDIFRLPSDLLPLLVQDNLVAPIDDFLTADDKAAAV